MAGRFTVAAEFQRLDDVAERGHEAVTALKAQIDGAEVSEPDGRGAFQVELDAESQDDAHTKVWHAAEQARITDYIDLVARRTT
jgi:hypothetical protein